MPYKPVGRFKNYVVNARRHTFAMPKAPQMLGNGLCNKYPEEYKNSHEFGRTKNGLKWYYRLKRRGSQRNFPWVDWNSDPMGHTKEAPPKMFCRSHQQEADLRRIPKWNVYELDRIEFHLDPGTARFPQLLPFLRTYLGSAFTADKILHSLQRIQTKFDTIIDLLNFRSVPRDIKHPVDGEYSEQFPRHSIGNSRCGDSNYGSVSRFKLGLSAMGNGPGSNHIRGYHRVLAELLFDHLNSSNEDNVSEIFLLHVVMLCNAIVSQNLARRHRLALQKNHAILRTGTGERYYALPYLRTGPCWPEKYAQAGNTPSLMAGAHLIPNKPTTEYSAYFDRKYYTELASVEFLQESDVMPESSLRDKHPVFSQVE